MRSFLICLAAMAAIASADAAPAVYKQVSKIPAPVENAAALAVCSDGTIVIGGENALGYMAPGGKIKLEIPLKSPASALCVTPDGNIVLAMRDRLQVYDSKGATVAEGEALPPRSYITSVAADDDNVYAADAGNRLVLRFDNRLHLLNKIGERNFIVPSPCFDLAIDPQGALWVVNPGRHGLENYRPNGDLIGAWYRPGSEPEAFCGCCNPTHIAFLGNCRLVTAEKGIPRVKVYAPDTSLSATVCPGASEEAQSKPELSVKDLAVDAADRVFILNGSENAVIIYDAGSGEREKP